MSRKEDMNVVCRGHERRGRKKRADHKHEDKN